MAISDFDFSGGFSPVGNQQFGVAAPSKFDFKFDPNAPRFDPGAYTSGLGVDTATYDFKQQKKARDLSWLDIAGLGMGVAGDIVRGTQGKDPVFGPSLISKRGRGTGMAGDLLGSYFGDTSTDTDDLAPLFAAIFNKKMANYLKSASSGQPMA
jgi:hypothetical protein